MSKKKTQLGKVKEIAIFFIKGFFVLVLALLPGVLTMLKFDPYLFLGLQKGQRIYIPNERFQIPGLARHERYDTVILGTSMIENFSEKYANQKLNANTIRLPINASYITEQKYVLDMAKKYNDVKTVIWAVDFRTVDIRPGEIYSKNNVVFPEYMYDENPINDWKYIINHNNFFWALKQFQMRKTGVNPFDYMVTDREILNTWNWKTFNRQLIIQDYKDLYTGKKSIFDKINNLPLSITKETIDRYLIESIKQYPDTKFILFFAPKSILWFKLLDQRGMLENKLETLTYVVDKASAYNNVEIYNFQNCWQFTENLDIYLDITHYNNTANTFMTDCFAQKRLMTDPQSFRRDNEELIKRVRSDEISKLAEEALK
jgi:hypothetical protein